MVSSASVYIFAVVAAVLLFGCECQNGGTLTFPDDNNEPLSDRQQFRPRPPRPWQPRPQPQPVTSSTEKPAGNPEVQFRPSCNTCSYTPQYNPVCGSDGQTYANEHILNCERACGKDVTMVVPGSCGANRG